jgi:hypothetical protein
MRYSSARVTVIETTCDEARRHRRDDADMSLNLQSHRCLTTIEIYSNLSPLDVLSSSDVQPYKRPDTVGEP